MILVYSNFDHVFADHLLLEIIFSVFGQDPDIDVSVFYNIIYTNNKIAKFEIGPSIPRFNDRQRVSSFSWVWIFLNQIQRMRIPVEHFER